MSFRAVLFGTLLAAASGSAWCADPASQRLLGYESRESLGWLSYPFHQHYIFTQLNGGVANNLEKRLGPRFDVRAFHDTFLAEGHLPLSMARERMETWMEDQARK